MLYLTQSKSGYNTNTGHNQREREIEGKTEKRDERGRRRKKKSQICEEERIKRRRFILKKDKNKG